MNNKIKELVNDAIAECAYRAGKEYNSSEDSKNYSQAVLNLTKAYIRLSNAEAKKYPLTIK